MDRRRNVISIMLNFSLVSLVLIMMMSGNAFAQTVITQSNKFPIVITKPGSYQLGSNLIPPTNKNAIEVKANNVTIDLDGYSIEGSPTTTGVWAILGTFSTGIVVKKGILKGICLSLGQNSLVEDVIAIDCTQTDAIDVGSNGSVLRSQALGGHDQGILCGIGQPPGTPANNCLFADDISTDNVQNGIECLGNGCNVTRDTANDNGANGLDCNGTGCLFNGNVSNSNALAGIATLDHTSAFTANILNGNETVPFGAATSLGDNLCNGSAC